MTLVFTGCGGQKDPTPSPTPSPTQEQAPVSGSLAEYFPLKLNTLYDYQGIGSEAMSQKIFHAYVKDSVVQRYIATASVRTTDVLALSGGQRDLTFLDPYSFRLDDVTGAEPQMKEVILKEPLTLGATWSNPATGILMEITDMAASVETPYGTFEAMEISSEITSSGNIYAQRDYYVKGLGLVKSISEMQNGPVIGYELASLTENAVFSLPYYYFTPAEAGQEYSTLMEERTLELTTNMSMVKIMEEQFQTATEENEKPILSANAKVNSIEADMENGRLTVDFSKEFVTEMADKDPAENIVQAVVNTLGNLYRVTEVRILVDGKGFDNGTLMLSQDEYTPVELPERQPAPEDALEVGP